MNALTRSASAYWHSSIGKKLIVAVTGVVLFLFLAGHMVGNLLVFAGRDVFNEYALFLQTSAHGGLVWGARLVLLVSLVAHVAATISLTRANRRAREQYQNQNTIQASRSSRIMMWSGLTILAFIIYHLLHFTFRAANDYNSYVDPQHFETTGIERHDAWRMVIEGFSWFPAVLFYLIALTLLCSHLSHGVSSTFQTLGLRTKRSRSLIDGFGKFYALAVWIGFMVVPIAVFFFGFGR
jgi:succinate dehydrogenase / fumarate reductase, cytochrome b subunit